MVNSSAHWSSVCDAGVVVGDKAWALINHAKQHGYAMPAFNVSSSSTINAVLEGARAMDRPVMIQFSQGGAQFLGGKSLPNDKDKQQTSVLGAVAGAHFVRNVAKAYGIPVILHSDHCAKKLLPWFDGMLAANEEYYKKNGESLFSSHMLDLSEETDEENLEICAKYLERMAKMNMILEMEIGITGGEEDGVNNENVDQSKLYTTPEQVWAVYQKLSPISEKFTIAAAFGNVHGVYKPGNVSLQPGKLGEYQAYASEKLGLPAGSKPLNLVFHGGSGSTKEEIATALSNGVIKMNIDTDTQWAYWEGILNMYEGTSSEGKGPRSGGKRDFLQSQIGNPDGLDKPNKKHYDPRAWIRKCEESMCARVQEGNRDLNNVNNA